MWLETQWTLWAQSAMLHSKICFCWVHDGLLAVSSATCVPHCLACLPVAALDSFHYIVAQLQCTAWIGACVAYAALKGSIYPTEKSFCGVMGFVLRAIDSRASARVYLYGWRKLRWLSVWLSPHEIHLVSIEGSGRVLADAVGSLNQTRYLVDPASSHMLVSKIKPCMSKYKPV